MLGFSRDRILHLRIRMEIYDLPPNTILEAAEKAHRDLRGISTAVTLSIKKIWRAL